MKSRSRDGLAAKGLLFCLESITVKVAESCLHEAINKLTSVFHASALFIDHEFRHNIVKVAVNSQSIP